jgi:hypothetical protein
VIANSAFLAGLVVMLLTFFIAGELSFLAPYKGLILRQYLTIILGALAIGFLNLFALFYLLTRSLFLKDTGRKLAHVEKQLRTGDSIVRDLSARLAEDD